MTSASSAIAAGRSFAAKNGYAINANRDFAALGLANISSGLTQGFCISGAESRTAINDSAKGRTQIVGVENFTTRVRALVSAAPEPLRFFLYDAEASWGIDSTAADELRLLVAELRERDIRFGSARSKGLFQTMLERTGLRDEIGADNVFRFDPFGDCRLAP